MSTGALLISLASPAAEVLNTEARKVTVETKMGQITILPSHVPFVAWLGAGPIVVETSAGQSTEIFVAGGFVEVFANQVKVLADAIELAKEIDESRARAALARATERLKGAVDVSVDMDRAVDSSQRAQARLDFKTCSRTT